MSTPHPARAIEFEWDENNEDKLAERNILPSDVEYVWANRPKYERNKNTGSATWRMIGKDRGGRTLRIGIRWADERERRLRAIYAWPV